MLQLPVLSRHQQVLPAVNRQAALTLLPGLAILALAGKLVHANANEPGREEQLAMPPSHRGNVTAPSAQLPKSLFGSLQSARMPGFCAA